MSFIILASIIVVSFYYSIKYGCEFLCALHDSFSKSVAKNMCERLQSEHVFDEEREVTFVENYGTYINKYTAIKKADKESNNQESTTKNNE